MCEWAVETLFHREAAGVPALGYAALPRVVERCAEAAAADAANAAAARRALEPGGALLCPDAASARDENTDEPSASELAMSWASAPERMPPAWHEAADAAARLERARARELPFISRRRAEAEAPQVLAARALPNPHRAPDRAAHGRRPAVAWPRGAPARPIHISQLYHPGVYAEIRAEVAEHAALVKEALGTGRSIPKRPTRIWQASVSQPAWARECVWDCADPADCVPMQPYTVEDPPPDGIDRGFFRRWAARLDWPDTDMVEQVTECGVEGRSELERATVIMGHHGGLRGNPQPARESIEHDTGEGWMTAARPDLWTVPARLVPKNVVTQHKWRLDHGKLVRKLKYRVTTDDSIEPEADGVRVDSRNVAMDRGDWGGVELPGPGTLAEAVAIFKSKATTMGVEVSAPDLERVAMWAIDLSNAYRELAVARTEHWQQCFVWEGGVKLDLRCVFGAAHMVDFFQRVSTFVLAVAQHRIREFDERFPHGTAREQWRAWRAARLGGVQEAAFSSIYLDDASGGTPLDADEPLHGAPPSQREVVRTHAAVEPDGRGGARVRLGTFVNCSRAEIHLAIARTTFAEAGWSIANGKVQLGFDIDLLGLAVTSQGDGCIYVPDVKRRGMRADIAEQRAAPGGSVPRERIEELTGRCSYVAQVACEGNAYLQPMYRMQNATRVVGGVRRKLNRIRVAGDTETQRSYAAALDWWDSALSAEITVPLAPRTEFPRLDEAGCAYFFTDAAREEGTGYGAHCTLTLGGRAFFVFREQRWPAEALEALRNDSFSMPAGECFGAVIFADALLRALSGVTHMVCFTDSDATAKAFTAAGSGAPQLNHMIQWLLARHPGVQLLGVHQPGARNGAADGLSRAGRQQVLQEAAAAGAELIELQFSAADAVAEAALLAAAMRCPLRR